MKILLLLLLAFYRPAAFAGVDQISEAEFRVLAAELAPKVNLFREGWKANPEAEFYGGTTRDYLYWLKGEFQNAHTKAQAQSEIAKLKALPFIDVRSFLIGDSDVDIIGTEAPGLRAADFGVRKLDFQSADILDPNTELGKNEKLQGYIPAEKIRLGREGFHPTGLGDGIKEIYEGKLSVHFASAEDFAKSKYAQEGLNHPILLSLRYIRLQAINYFRSHGKGFPNHEKLFAGMDEASAKQVRAVIDKAVSTGELEPFLKENKFRSWINGGIQKSFRSYTNPTAALELMNEFGVGRLPARYPSLIEPLNQYVFAKYRDPPAIRAAMHGYNVNEKEFFTPPTHYFPDGKLYHGTKTEAGFRNIVFQGSLPSEGGNAGAGLYGVAAPDKKFSEDWARDKNRLLAFPVDPHAKLVDITKGEGKRVWEAANLDYDEFSDHFGVDIISYPYNPQAFVVKNASILEGAEGVYRTMMPLGALVEKVKTMKSVEDVANLVTVNSLSTPERILVWQTAPVSPEKIIKYLRRPDITEEEINAAIDAPSIQHRPEFGALLKKWALGDNGEDQTRQYLAKDFLTADPHPSPERLALLESLFKTDELGKSPEIEGALILYLEKHATPSPTTVAYALRHAEASWPIEKGQESWRISQYLHGASLKPAEAKRAFDLYANPKIPFFYKNYIVAPLLRSGYRHEEVRKAALDQVEHTAWQELRENLRTVDELKKMLPNDTAVAEHAVHLLREAFPRVGGNNHGALPISEIMRVTKDIPGVKEFFLEKLAVEDDRSKTLQSMPYFDLSDHEFAQALDWTDKQNIKNFSLEKILPKHTGNLSQEVAEALLRAYMRNPTSHPLVAEALKSYAHPDVLQNYLEKIMSTPEIVMRGRGARYKFWEVQMVLTPLTEGLVPSTPALQTKILDYLEATMEKDNPHLINVTEWVKTISPEDHASLQRVARLEQEGRIFLPPEVVSSLKGIAQNHCAAGFAQIAVKP